MSYVSRTGKRPNEFASKISHTHIINDPDVTEYLEKCKLPSESKDVELEGDYLETIEDVDDPIEYIIAIDGGYSEVNVRKNFPSSRVAFFQFGSMLLDLKLLYDISENPFISPEQMAKLKDLNKIKLVLPISNVIYDKKTSLIDSVRGTFKDFFDEDRDGGSFFTTLKWFIFEEYSKGVDSYTLASCPDDGCENKNITLSRADIDWKCSCGKEIYLTDVFRLHEAIDNELGASGILGYVTTLLEQIIMVHNIRYIYNNQPSLFNRVLFMKDGPLAFFGQTANMHKKMRSLINFLSKDHFLNIIGLEKSGAFVEHAHEICSEPHAKLKSGEYLLLSNEYIYRNIIPGEHDTNKPYASSSYYGSKLIYKDAHSRVYVASIPVENNKIVLDPKKEKFKNLDVILKNVSKMKCDMYENSLVPIAFINKLVSLSLSPSSHMLAKFAKSKMDK